MESTQETTPTSVHWTVSEFHAKTKLRHDRLWIGCLIGGGLALLWALPFMSALSDRNPSSSSLFDGAVYCVGVVGMISLQCAGVALWQRFLTRGLHCPECHQELLNQAPLVISSHRCCHCGCIVLNENGV